MITLLLWIVRMEHLWCLGPAWTWRHAREIAHDAIAAEWETRRDFHNAVHRGLSTP